MDFQHYKEVGRKYIHDIDISFNRGHKFYLLNTENIYESYEKLGWLLRYHKSKSYGYTPEEIENRVLSNKSFKITDNFTINENVNNSKKLICFYIDLDINKLDTQDKSFISKFIKDVMKEIKQIFGSVEIVKYINTKSNNIHIIARRKMKYKYVKAIHSIIQHNMNEKYCTNLNNVIDSSIGIRTILCKKQVEKVCHDKKIIVDFTDDFYYPEKMEKIVKDPNFDLDKMNMESRMKIIAEHSLFNPKYPTMKKEDFPEEVILETFRVNRFNLSEKKIETLKEKFSYTDKQLKKEGFINDPLREIGKKDVKFVHLNEAGQEIQFSTDILAKFLKVIDPKICDTSKGFFFMLRKIKSFALMNALAAAKKCGELVPDEEILNDVYDKFDAFCMRAKNYNKENNKRIYDSQTKLDFNFECIAKMVKKKSLNEYLKILGINKFDYYLYKAKKINVDIPKEIQYNEYEGRTQAFSDEKGCEIIQANMGHGKTAMCMEFLEKHKDKSVLIITCKRSLANNFKERFPDFHDYRDSKGSIYEDRVICQLESIYRIERSYQVVILDEIRELINQVISVHHKDITALREHLNVLMKNSIVKCMDAFIDNLVIDTIIPYREMDFIWNRNITKSRDDFKYIFETESGIKKEFLNSIISGKRVVVASNSLKHLKIAKTLCEENNISHFLVCGETSEKDKMDLTKERLEENQVFLYSPTITTGVDIQVPFDKVFCYFNNNCNDCHSCIQMTNRVRHVKDKIFHIHLRLMGCRMNENIDFLMEKKIKMFQGMNQYKQTMDCKMDKNFNIIYNKNSPWYKTIRNILMNRAKSHNNFTIIFMNLLLQIGGTIVNNTEVKKKEIEENKKAEKDWELASYVLDRNEMLIYRETEDINDDEYLLLKEKEIRTNEDEQKLRKYKIQDIFQIKADGDIFPKAKVNLNAHPLLKQKLLQRRFKNLHICNWMIENFKDRKIKRSAIENELLDDLVKGNWIQKLDKAKWILDNFTDTDLEKPLEFYLSDFTIHKNDLLKKFEFIKKKIFEINVIFECNKSPEWELRPILNYVNKILLSVYGMRIMTIASRENKRGSVRDRENYCVWFEPKLVEIFKSLEC